MGVCRSRWGRSLRLGLSQLCRTLHTPNFPLPKRRFIGHRRLRVIEPRAGHGASSLFVVGSVGGGTISR